MTEKILGYTAALLLHSKFDTHPFNSCQSSQIALHSTGRHDTLALGNLECELGFDYHLYTYVPWQGFKIDFLQVDNELVFLKKKH